MTCSTWARPHSLKPPQPPGPIHSRRLRCVIPLAVTRQRRPPRPPQPRPHHRPRRLRRRLLMGRRWLLRAVVNRRVHVHSHALPRYVRFKSFLLPPFSTPLAAVPSPIESSPVQICSYTEFWDLSLFFGVTCSTIHTFAAPPRSADQKMW